MESGTGEEREMQRLNVVGRIAVIPVHGVQSHGVGISPPPVKSCSRKAAQSTAASSMSMSKRSSRSKGYGLQRAGRLHPSQHRHEAHHRAGQLCRLLSGYYLAAACSRIIASPTAGVGSIGVIIETHEVSRMEDEMGITFNTHFRGDHKTTAPP